MRKSVIIIGGGINGAGIARDAAMRGLDVTLFEKNDFCSGTSWASSKLIHGGLRYLEHRELGLVRESLRERAILMHIHPGLITPIRLVIPVYDHSPRGLTTMRLGLAAYDMLAGHHTLPPHENLSVKELLEISPHLQQEHLRGGVAYYDGQCAFPERMVIDNLRSAADHGARVHNYYRVERLLQTGSKVQGVTVKNLATGVESEHAADMVINAAGPWVDDVLKGKTQLIGGTKGSHIVLANTIGLNHGIYVQARSDGRPFFILPWLNDIMIGTTDIRFEGNADRLVPSPEEIDYLCSESRLAMPSLRPDPASIIMSFAGIRPLPYSPKNSTAAITRRHIIVDHHRRDGVSNLISLVGGKLTTYRSASEQVVNAMLEKLSVREIPCMTHREIMPPFAGLSPEENVMRAVNQEWSQNLSDIMFRRTALGYSEDLGMNRISEVADQTAKFLSWDGTQKQEAVEAYRRYVKENLLSHRS